MRTHTHISFSPPVQWFLSVLWKKYALTLETPSFFCQNAADWTSELWPCWFRSLPNFIWWKKNSLILEWLNFRESWQNGVLQNLTSANFDISNLFRQPFKSKCLHFNRINSILQRDWTPEELQLQNEFGSAPASIFGMSKDLLAEPISWSQPFGNSLWLPVSLARGLDLGTCPDYTGKINTPIIQTTAKVLSSQGQHLAHLESSHFPCIWVVL